MRKNLASTYAHKLRQVSKNKLLTAGFVVVFGVAGLILLTTSNAATFVAAIEAESGINSNVVAVDDAAASGNKAIKFGSGPIMPPTPPPPTNGGAVSWPLKASSNGRYFADQNNKAFFYMSDTAWPMIGRMSVADAKKLIDIRKGQGYNTIQTLLVAWSRTASGSRGLAFQNGDITKPNESFWAGADEIIKYAEQQGMLLSVGPLASSDNAGMSSSAMATYGTWLGQRYKNYPNLVWYVGHDADPNQDAQANFALATALKAQIPTALISYHSWGLSYPWDNGAINQPWYGWCAIQWNGNTSPFTYDITNKCYTRTPVRPMINIEPAYEPNAADGTNTSELQNRENGWWAILAGAAGVVYGGPTGAWNIGASGTDFNATNRPAALQSAYIYKILGKYPWERLVPNSSAVSGGSGHIQTGVASDGSLIVTYTPGGGTLNVDLSKLSGGGTAQWYSPSSGAASGAAQSVTNSGSKAFTAPGGGDWVLVIAKS